jgi:hypothetical protein
MRFNAYNRELPAELDGIDTERVMARPVFASEAPQAGKAALVRAFGITPYGPLSTAACHPAYVEVDLTCDGGPAVIGALQPDGELFDIALPFGFPFTEVLRKASNSAK